MALSEQFKKGIDDLLDGNYSTVIDHVIDTKPIPADIYNKDFFYSRRTEAIDLVACLDPSKATTARGSLYFKRDGSSVGIKVLGYMSSYDHLGVKMHRLLAVALHALTQRVPGLGSVDADNACLVHIPLADYAYAIHKGHYDCADDKKITARRKEDRKITRREVKAVIETLEKIVITRDADPADPAGDFADLHLVTSAGLSENDIFIEFDSRFVNYITGQRTLYRYPTALLSLDARSQLAYALGCRLYAYAGYFRPQDAIIKLNIRKLLKYLPIPDPDGDYVKTHAWRSVLRDPLEAALNSLVAARIIKHWDYAPPGEAPDKDSYLASCITYTIHVSEDPVLPEV